MSIHRMPARFVSSLDPFTAGLHGRQLRRALLTSRANYSVGIRVEAFPLLRTPKPFALASASFAVHIKPFQPTISYMPLSRTN